MAGKPKTRADDARGAAPGERRGGREPGTPNKGATIQRAEVIEQELKQQGRVLAKDMLRHYMEEFHAKAQARKPQLDEDRQDLNPLGNEDDYVAYAKAACEMATRLAPYETPTFRSISIPAPPPEIPNPGDPGSPEARRRGFSLHIFDHQGRPAPKGAVLPAPAGANGKGNGHGEG